MIKISYNKNEEMMQIENGNNVIFYGNYWDFKHDPASLKDFLEELDLDVDIEDDLPALSEDDSDYDEEDDE